MVDLQRVCCLCGDVGFSDKLFRCSNCHHRFQHSYCSNYYGEYGDGIEVCDWCQCEKKINSSPATTPTSGKSGGKMKQHDGGGGSTERPAGKTFSPRPSIRRYKLLKDVMC